MELGAASATVDVSPFVKLLCSFGGNILPRPLDGRLRYVGGETRIATVSRKISYQELLARAREIYDGVLIIKYQQPDEDVDALVSVVNDDDVMNMMEEYDKFSNAGNGFTWLRIFLFSQIPDHNLPAAHFEADERENERRYIDALNSLKDANSSAVSDGSDPYSRHPSMDGGNYNQHSLHQLSIPLHSHGQRYVEMDACSNPALFSPQSNDPSEFGLSPSSSRLHLDEYVRQNPGLQLHPYDRHTQPLVENFSWLPAGAIVQEQSGFPTTLGHSHNMTEGSNVCEHCCMAFHKNHNFTPDGRAFEAHLKNGQPCLEQLNMANEYAGNLPNSYVECFGTRDPFTANQDLNMEHGIYVNEQNEQQHPSFYNEYDRGWAAHNHQVTHRLDNMRIHDNGTGRLNEHHVIDGSMVNAPFMQGNASNGHLLSSNYIGHDDTSYLRHGTNAGNEAYLPQQRVVGGFGNEVYLPQQTVGGGIGNEMYLPQQTVGGGIGNEMYLPQQTVGGGTGTYEQGFNDGAAAYRNQPFPHVVESAYQASNSPQPIQSSWRRKQVPAHPGTSYDSPNFLTTNGGEADLVRPNNTTPQWTVGLQDSVISGAPQQYGTRQNPHNLGQEDSFSHAPVSFDAGVQHPPAMASDIASPKNAADINLTVDLQQREHEILEQPDQQIAHSPTHEKGFAFAADGSKHSVVEGNKSNPVDANSVAANGHGSEDKLSFVPELIASVKQAILGGAEEVIASELDASSAPKDLSNECEPEETNEDDQPDSEGNGENEKLDKIEPTSAEAEALEKGLQTIKNDDLEEIRVLGSGTFGSVFYGKWKGSDVAIKRIKASCFAGRPSERDRLIADFWREALLMSSLHHPNVVSFYGVVRDGPDCSLATVSEYMVNGSLKQFLQKRDRTIDRRKRLIIAMDVAFGMEYLHGKNIVHFDLKCENLLVNMRDPQRPVCKIGDLGLSKVKQQTLVSGGLRGTLPWMAPELLSGKSNKVTDKIDVYSYGIVMWELLTGEEPYSGMHCASMIGGIVNNSIRPKSPSWCDPEWKSLMESCWSSDPTSRPSFSEIAQRLRKMAVAINLR